MVGNKPSVLEVNHLPRVVLALGRWLPLCTDNFQNMSFPFNWVTLMSCLFSYANAFLTVPKFLLESLILKLLELLISRQSLNQGIQSRRMPMIVFQWESGE